MYSIDGRNDQAPNGISTDRGQLTLVGCFYAFWHRGDDEVMLLDHDGKFHMLAEIINKSALIASKPMFIKFNSLGIYFKAFDRSYNDNDLGLITQTVNCCSAKN